MQILRTLFKVWLLAQIPQFLYVAWGIYNPNVGRPWANLNPKERDGITDAEEARGITWY